MKMETRPNSSWIWQQFAATFSRCQQDHCFAAEAVRLAACPVNCYSMLLIISCNLFAQYSSV